MKFFLSFIFSVLLVFILIFFNLGKIVDATTNPKKVDLLVCLGGGDYVNRGKKSLELFQNGLVNTNTIIFTGYTNIKDFKGADVIFNRTLNNTYEEVIYVKKYMKEHGLKSATFISEAPHSRRILLFTKLFGEGDFEFSVVASRFEWDASKWYAYPHMRAYVFSEVTKLFYNLFLYGVLDSIGLKESFENTFEENIQNGKRLIAKGIV